MPASLPADALAIRVKGGEAAISGKFELDDNKKLSLSVYTAPVGLHGELMMTPRVRSVATAAIESSVGLNFAASASSREASAAA